MIILHRINTVEELNNVPTHYGVEIDIRGYGNTMLLNHDPISDPSKHDELEEYLKNFKQAFIIFNTKEAGYEQRIIDLAKKYKIHNYFLLDVDFPYLYRATRKEGVRKIAVRYSEAEPIELVEAQIKENKPLLDWVWVDTNTILPLDKDIVGRLKRFRTCLVCPERWGRPQDVELYIKKIKKLNFKFDAVMTTQTFAPLWEQSGVVNIK